MPRKEPRPRRLKVTHYVLDGQRVKKGTQGAERVKGQTDTFYVSLDGKWHSLETTDEQVAWENLRQLLRRRKDESLGIRDHLTDAAERPISSHLDDWLTATADGGTGANQIAALRADVSQLIAAAGWKCVGDIDGDGALAALAALVAEHGLSQRTRNHKLAHLKQFTRWLARPEKPQLRADPLAAKEPIPVTDLRHERRVPTAEELTKLFTFLASAGCPMRPRGGMTGPQRALGYQLMAVTGYRASELRRLKRTSFDVACSTVTLTGKNKRRTTQPLPSWLTERLLAWFAAGGGCWDSFPRQFPGRILKADLKSAGVAYEVAGPEGDLHLDMHAIGRKAFITALSNTAGIDPKTLKDLARHSDAELTLTVYAEGREGARRAAVEALPDHTATGDPWGVCPATSG